VRAQLGAPAAERKLASGETAWYYVTGPSSFFTWRVVFGASGTATEYAQVLNASNFEWVRQAATREAVLDHIGPPMERMSFARTSTEVWTYRWQDGTLEMIADAVFDAQRGDVRYVAIYRDPAYSSGVNTSP